MTASRALDRGRRGTPNLVAGLNGATVRAGCELSPFHTRGEAQGRMAAPRIVLLRLLQLSALTAVATSSSRQTLQLTPLGATLTPAQRSELRAAAQRIVAGGGNRWPSYTSPGALANYYAPDDHTDPRRHYASQYVRDFTYTFTMASDVPALVNMPRDPLPVNGVGLRWAYRFVAGGLRELAL